MEDFNFLCGLMMAWAVYPVMRPLLPPNSIFAVLGALLTLTGYFHKLPELYAAGYLVIGVGLLVIVWTAITDKPTPKRNSDSWGAHQH